MTSVTCVFRKGFEEGLSQGPTRNIMADNFSISNKSNYFRNNWICQLYFTDRKTFTLLEVLFCNLFFCFVLLHY